MEAPAVALGAKATLQVSPDQSKHVPLVLQTGPTARNRVVVCLLRSVQLGFFCSHLESNVSRPRIAQRNLCRQLVRLW